MDRYRSAVIGSDQRPCPYSVIEVRTTGVSSPLPTLYDADSALNNPTTTINNPFLSDSLGNYAFAAPDGDYDILISGPGLQSRTLRHVKLFDNTVTYPSPMLGTVTSVALGGPADLFTFGAAVTSSGTLTMGKASVAQNAILAGPASGGAGVWTFRAMVAADLPDSGVVAATYGGAAVSPALVIDAKGRVTAAVDVPITAAWSGVTGKPTTISGYGITNAVECLYSAYTLKTISNTVAETTMFGTGAGTLTIPANRLAQGSVVRIRLTGYVARSTGSTDTLRVKVGGNTVGSLSIVGLGASTIGFSAFIDLVVTTGGATGAMQAIMRTPSAQSYLDNIYNSSGAYSPLNFTTALVLDVTYQWGAAAVGNSLNIQNATVEILR